MTLVLLFIPAGLDHEHDHDDGQQPLDRRDDVAGVVLVLVNVDAEDHDQEGRVEEQAGGPEDLVAVPHLRQVVLVLEHHQIRHAEPHEAVDQENERVTLVLVEVVRLHRIAQYYRQKI